MATQVKYVIKKAMYGKIPMGIVMSAGKEVMFDTKEAADKYLVMMNTPPNRTNPLFQFKVEPVEIKIHN